MPARSASPIHLAGRDAVELVLRDADGAPWVLAVSPGMERFVGAYPRVDGFDAGGPLVLFHPARLPD